MNEQCYAIRTCKTEIKLEENRFALVLVGLHVRAVDVDSQKRTRMP